MTVLVTWRCGTAKPRAGTFNHFQCPRKTVTNAKGRAFLVAAGYDDNDYDDDA